MSPKKENVESLADLNHCAACAELVFANTAGETLVIKNSMHVPSPGDYIVLGSLGSFIALRMYHTYADESDRLVITVVVRQISQPGGF